MISERTYINARSHDIWVRMHEKIPLDPPFSRLGLTDHMRFIRVKVISQLVILPQMPIHRSSSHQLLDNCCDGVIMAVSIDTGNNF